MALFTTDSGAGAAQGAAAGGAAGGPWGALIGAVLGHFAGGAAGRRRKKARKYAELAAKARRKQQNLELAVRRRDLVRTLRMQRAAAVAAGASDEGVDSSAVVGAISSIQAQGKASMNFFDNMAGLDAEFQAYAKQAERYGQKANDIMSMLGVAGSAAGVGADIYGAVQLNQRPQTSAPTTASTSFNSTAAYTNLSNTTAMQSFGSSLDLG